MNNPETIGLVIGIGLPALLLLIAWIKTNMIICQPNELVILAGREYRQDDGTVLGYRVIRGGRGFRRPFVESVARLPLNALSVRFELSKVLCKGMIPVIVEGKANVKLAGRAEMGMDRAIERFLGKGPEGVMKAAQQAIEGALRGVIVGMSPEDANRDRIQLTKDVTAAARADLFELGIVLDFIQIQSIYDDHGYLDAIGRQRSAEVQRDAQVAEARANAEARQVAAEQTRLGREAEIAADLVIVEKENGLTVKRSELQAAANQAEQRAQVAGTIARTEEQIQLETRRVELVGKREQANTVIPAKAKSDARKIAAEGYAARILEEGRATAKAVEMMQEQWAGGEAKDLFMIRMLPELVEKVTSVIADNLRVDRLTILDSGDGNGLPNYIHNLTKSAVSMLEQVHNATGVDMAAMASGDGASTSPPLPPELG